MKVFKDNFSKQAAVYSRFRPSYPEELFRYLRTLTPGHELAWDCGTGNGQSALQLTAFYDRVYATDPSAEQIKNAVPDQKIKYAIEKAESPSLNDRVVDLITVAQAIHWFDFDAFYTEVKRVLKPNGIIAVWAYGIPVVDDDLDAIIRNFHDKVLGAFWLPENKLIETEYATIPFPFEEIMPPTFFIQKNMTMAELLGHFRSWSATQKYIDHYGHNPIEPLQEQMRVHWTGWGDEKKVAWKLILKVGRMTCCQDTIL